jgi:signal peptidase I
VTVDDRPLDEPYIFENTPLETRSFGPVTVPQGRLWVMGDHRNSSADSRSHLSDGFDGTIPTDDVIGRAFVKVWPPKHWGTLPVPSTFGQKGLAAAATPPVLGFALALPLTLLRRRLRRR